MRIEERVLVALLSDYIHGSRGKYVSAVVPENMHLTEENWRELQRLAYIHGVGGMLYLALKESRLGIPREAGRFRRDFDFAVMHAVKQELEMTALEEAFREAGIRHIFFKGWEIRNYYPVPEVRMMSDVDFLIQKEDTQRACKALEDAGFVQEQAGVDVLCYDKNALHLEMHRQIREVFDNGSDCTAWFADAFSHGIFKENDCRGYFSPEYHFVFLLFHLAKHINSMGAGVRMFLDIAVFWKHFADEMDLKEVWRMLDELNLRVFTESVFWLCGEWFHVEIPGGSMPEKELYEQLTEYVFQGGIYGKHKRTIAGLYSRGSVTEDNIGKTGRQKRESLVRYFFPTRKQMEGVLPAVRKYPVLLPAAWMLRWCRGLFLRRKHSVKVLKEIRQGSPEAEKEYRMLKKLGLK